MSCAVRFGIQARQLLCIAACLAAAVSLRGAEYTIFSFDDRTIPFKSNLKLTLAPMEKYAGNPVVPRGPRGSADAYRVQFYGSILHIHGRFRMWYMAGADAGNLNSVDTGFRPAYAESTDGIHWTKPDLGLTEFAGNRHNNLVEITPTLDLHRLGPLVCFVLHEPEDKDPARRYKMLMYGRYYESNNPQQAESQQNTPTTVFPFFSADGLRWKLAIPAPKGPWFVESEVPFPVKNNFELGGLYKFDGIYYAAGQEMWPDISQPDGTRVRRTMVTHWSGDFIHWSHDRSYSFQRYGYRNPDVSLEEAHEPAGVWHRGNVLVATYGLWHGASDRKQRRMDLGLLVSNDGIHFREPVADFAIIPAGPDGAWDQRGLIHAQGYVNVGEKTYIYFGNWDPSQANEGIGAVGLATMPRDRFGYLSVREAEDGLLTTTPIRNPRTKPALYVNADGLSRDARIEIELIGKNGGAIRKLPPVTESGLRVKAGTVDAAHPELRLRMRFAGPGVERVRFYAAYIE